MQKLEKIQTGDHTRGRNETHLSEAVEYTNGRPHPGPQHVGHEEVHAPTLHVTALTHPNGTHRSHQGHTDGQQDDDHRQTNPSIALDTQTDQSQHCPRHTDRPIPALP